MAAPELMLHLEDARTVFHPGDRIAGEAHVVNDSEWTATQFVVELRWSTYGRGDQDTGAGAVQVLAPPGQEVPARSSHRFALTVPPLPWTYHGRALKIGWCVRLYAGGRHITDSETTVDFELRPRPEPAGVDSMAPPDLPPPE
ncbi:MAG: hypothetical protein SF028_11510 [Candidatus Sumerlaeia bacterium]|nr:hypothetical protein [Candidatus Sumerlaeia bacterium]